MKSIKYLITLVISLFALQSFGQGYKIILKDGRTASVRADETEIITFSKSINTQSGTMPGYRILLSDGRSVTIGVDETEIFTFTTDKNLKTNISSLESIAVSSINLNRTSLTLTEGEGYSLSASVSPSNATNKEVTWSSSNTRVASVDNYGYVTANSVGSTTITATATDGSGVYATCYVDVESSFVYVSSISLNYTSLSMTVGDTEYLNHSISPYNATNTDVTWSSSNTSVATVNSNGMVTAKNAGNATITVKANDGSGVKATCTVSVKTKVVSPKAVDLGLSVKWADINVGANSPEEYGDYFAWGETSPKAKCSLDNYKYYKQEKHIDKDGMEVTNSGYTKYVLNSQSEEGLNGYYDNKTKLDYADDAAYVNWGGNWRMPTFEEFNELCEKCTWVSAIFNDVSGWKVIGPNGNFIFLPHAGIYTSYRPGKTQSIGSYWTSNLSDTKAHNAYRLLMYNMTYQCHEIINYGDGREYGMSVRAVCK